ncbi:glycosyltransferase family A protein [Roseateles sp.]|uniref:glycosyltransferase family A protein n=1 Tax=Roseateles sp. TaxID=1971397 RepID=UPI003BA68E5B
MSTAALMPPLNATVSVIVPTYNRAHYLRECLDSLLTQTVLPYEVIVVDDGSSDDTPQVLQSYGSRICAIRKENGGKPVAVNLGAERAVGQWLWILDDDDVALPDAIETRLRVLQGSPDADFVYAPHWVGSDGQEGRIQRSHVNQPLVPAEDAFFLDVMRACFFHLGTTLVRRERFQDLGGLDPSLRAGEDYDFQIRLARMAQAAYCPSPAFIFRQHGGARGATADSYKAEQRERVFRECSQVIGRRLRHRLELGEYLVPRIGAELNPEQRARALHHRAQVMGNHGCIAELLDDVEQIAVSGSDLDSAALARAIQRGWAYSVVREDWPGFWGRARVLRATPRGRAALRALAGGIAAMARGYPGTPSQRLQQARHAAVLWLSSLSLTGL